MKKILTKNNLIVLFGGIILTLILLLPGRFSRLKQEPFAPFCPFFTDKNQDAICDVLQDIQTPKNSFDFSFWPQATIFIFLLVLSILSHLSNKLKWLRIYLLIFSVIYFGFFWSKICPVATLQSIFLQKEKIVLELPLFLIFILPIITSLLFGQVFCHFLCPLGGFQELIFKISRKLPIKIPNLTPKIPKKFFCLPYFILLILILGTISTSSLFFCRFEPWGQIFGCKTNLFSFILLFSTLILSLLIFRPCCRLFCPLGAVFKFLSKFQILKRNLKEENKK